MKIVFLTPGTGEFFCGTCLRDTALAEALKKRGHEVTLLPLYLPLVSEGPSDVCSEDILLGGINMYLQQHVSLFRHTPRWVDSVFDSKPFLKMAAKKSSMTEAKDLGPMMISMLQGMQGHQSKEISFLIQWFEKNGKPDLICLSNILLLGLAKELKSKLAVPIVCTAQGEDSFVDSLPPEEAAKVWSLITEASEHVLQIVAVSDYYAKVLKEKLQLPEGKISVLHNGIDLQGFDRDEVREWPEELTIGFLSRMSEAKGLGFLIEAFIEIKKDSEFSELKLKVAGSQTPGDLKYVENLIQVLKASGCEKDVTFHPNLSRSEKIDFLKSLTLLSVPASYGEAFGLYVIEALAAGVPVLQPDNGAFPEIIEATGGGLCHEVGNIDSLVNSWKELLKNGDKARKMAAQGQNQVFEKFSADVMASGFEQLGKWEK